MKKLSKLSSAIGTSAIYLYSVASVYAQSSAPLLRAPVGSVKSNTKVEAIPQLIINIVFSGAIFLAVLYLMFGGIKLMTAKGDRASVESARKHIFSAVTGLVVVAGTFFILQIIFNVLGADNPLSKGFTLPTVDNVDSSPKP